MFSDCRCCLITAFVGDNKLILILSYLKRGLQLETTQNAVLT